MALCLGMRHEPCGDSSAVRWCDGRELEQFVYNFQNFNLFKQVYPPSLLQERINTKTIWKIIKAFFVFAYFNFNYFNFKNVVPYLAYSSGDMG